MNLSPAKPILLLAALLIVCAHPAHAEKGDRNKPLNIVSDSLNVDDANHTSTFEGRVELTQGTLRVNAQKIVVTEDAAGNKHCLATGKPANFRQKRDIVNEYVEGYGERIEYDSRSGTVDFFVHARVKRDQDDVRGDHIIYNSLTDVFHVEGRHESGRTDGRVHATILPKSKETAAEPAPKTETTKGRDAIPDNTLTNKP